MKKFKKISAMLAAAIISAGTVSSLSSGAIYLAHTKDDFKELFEDACMIPTDYTVANLTCKKDSIYYRNNRTFILETETDNLFDIYSIDYARPDYISASLYTDVDADALTAAMKEICPDAEIVKITPSDNENDINIMNVIVKGMDDSKNWRLPFDEVIKKDITYEQAIKIYDLLNETGKLKTFDYTKESVAYSLASYTFTIYSCDRRGSNNLENVQNYIAKNNLNWSVDIKKHDYTDASEFTVTTGKRMSAEENLIMAEQLANALGILPHIGFDESANFAAKTTIDMHNNLKGDANDDGELRLSDAILILQSIGNPDEYQLTQQGKYNADIYGDRDGITTMDAVAVQRKILGLE